MKHLEMTIPSSLWGWSYGEVLPSLDVNEFVGVISRGCHVDSWEEWGQESIGKETSIPVRFVTDAGHIFSELPSPTDQRDTLTKYLLQPL